MKHLWTLTGLVVLATSGIVSPAFSQMDPPGPPGSPEAWVKPLNMVEPRTMITSLPYAISNAGSYYLVSNLVGRTGNDGIIIAAGDVKVDLNGYALVGVPGTVCGIYAVGAALSNITIQNGAIRNWGSYGIRAYVGKGIQVTGVKSYSNSGDGMWLGENAMVKECMAFDNGGKGFDLGVNAVIIDCEARGNSNIGIDVGAVGKVRGCVAFGNQMDGLVASSNATITACSAIQNKGDGIQVGTSCRVTDSNCVGNGSGSGTGSGIHATGARNRIQDNNVTLNDYGIQTDVAGNLVIRNSASGNGGGPQDDYSLAPSTVFGRIERPSGEIGLISPWANFGF